MQPPKPGSPAMPPIDLAPTLQAAAAVSPFLGVAATVLIHQGAVRLHARLGAPALLHPLLISIAAVALGLELLGLPYERYFESAEALHLLLGPVVVLLAVPLWRRLGEIRRLGPRLLPVLAVGAVSGIATSAGLALLLGAPDSLVATLAPKSVTTPVAIGLAETMGGVPAVTALVVILTGLAGATLGPPALRLIGVRDARARGLGLGVGAHAIGTARAFQTDETLGTYASLGMILNALATAGLFAAFSLLAAG